MKKEKRDILNQFRYFEILEECYIEINGKMLPVKRGDIIKIYNSQLEDLVFRTAGGILWYIGYGIYAINTSDFQLKEYPKDKPFDIIEYLRIQPQFQLQETTGIDVLINSREGTYLTPKIVDRMLNDSENSVRLGSGRVESVSTYNRRQIINFDGKLNYLGAGLKMLGDGSENDNGDEITETKTSQRSEENLSEKIMRMRPGLYSTDSSSLDLSLFLEKGEIIDFSKPEYAFLAIKQNFMRVLTKMIEITNIKKKAQIYQREQKDFLPGTTIRYYRINSDVDIKSLMKQKSDIEQDNEVLGIRFNPQRIKGNIRVVEEDSERISVVKVEYTNSAVYDMVDREMRKVSKRLTKKEAISMHLQEVCRKQRKAEEDRAREAKRKGKDYFRIKMMAELARTYINEGSLTEEFKDEAYEYYEKNKKLYWDTWKILGMGEFDWDDFYMMHLIRTGKKDNRLIDAEYKQKLQEKRDSLIGVLGSIKSKREAER